jgi:hypothetical protein
MTGDCRDIMAAGAESNVPSTINVAYHNLTYALGAALRLIETCDQNFCTPECL